MAGDSPEIGVVLKLLAEQFQSELKKSKGLLGEFHSFISDGRVQLAAWSASLLAIAKSTANAGEEALKGAQRAGMLVEAWQEVAYSARLADVETTTLQQALKNLSTNMVEASQGTKEQADTFAALKLSAKDAHGQLKPLEQMLLEVADRFAHMEDGALKNALGVKIFGKAFLEILPWLNQGKEGIQAYMAEARTLGFVMSEEAARDAHKFNDDLKRLHAQMQGMTRAVGKELIPVLDELMRTMIEVSRGPVGEAVSLFFTSLMFKIKATGMELGAFGAKWALAFSDLKGWATQSKEFLAAYNAIDELLEKDKLALAQRLSGEGPKAKPISRPDVFTPEVTVTAERARGFYDSHVELYRKVAEEKLRFEVQWQKDAGAVWDKRHQQELRDLEQSEKEWAEWGEKAGKIYDERTAKAARATEEALKFEHDWAEASGKIWDQRNKHAMLAEMDLWELYRYGLKEYLTNQESTFNIAIDMARTTFQGMASGFKSFFVDVLKGQATDVLSILAGIRDFAINVIADVASRLAAAGLLRAVAGAGLSGLLGGGYDSAAMESQYLDGKGQGFASGGSFRVGGFGGTDSQFVGFWATPGEKVDVRTPGQADGRPVVQNFISVQNQHPSAGVEVHESSDGDGSTLIQFVIKEVRGAMARGEFDRTFQTNFGLSRTGYARG